MMKIWFGINFNICTVKYYNIYDTVYDFALQYTMYNSHALDLWLLEKAIRGKDFLSGTIPSALWFCTDLIFSFL